MDHARLGYHPSRFEMLIWSDLSLIKALWHLQLRAHAQIPSLTLRTVRLRFSHSVQRLFWPKKRGVGVRSASARIRLSSEELVRMCTACIRVFLRDLFFLSILRLEYQVQVTVSWT